MPLDIINTGKAPNDGQGDPPRVAWIKQNKNNAALAGGLDDAKAAAAAALTTATVAGISDATPAGKRLLSATGVLRSRFMAQVSFQATGGLGGFLGFISPSPDDPVNQAFYHAEMVAPGDVLAVTFLAYAQASSLAQPPGLGLGSASATVLLAAILAAAA